jgi:hypothetical protein
LGVLLTHVGLDLCERIEQFIVTEAPQLLNHVFYTISSSRDCQGIRRAK